ncbi:Methyltransferase domain-containing protein [Halobiforma haloterrestris]|uniref:Methyltransferase domain-containing protein n=1 Tax=Natronobacterium haloterrestre TaxID=148448 RepID=A0A1I1EYV1_NATHA|nr:methyltransferase domain-containing protein [Halobiforma haloterrestris]SFB92244.1 Methyltransferase domain-containing protein [Halobiforma haloterrestris]
MSASESPGSAQEFYGRWAALYDLIARKTPGVPHLRRRAAAACRLEPGDTVVEMGCGTGANLPSLREAVGPEGTVIGVDFTGPVLERARDLVSGYDNVHVVRGDATRPPLNGAADVDAVLATFVVGMLEDPAGAVDDWCDMVGDGHVVLANAARNDGGEWYAPAVNAAFRAIVVLSTPPTTRLRYEDDPTGRLDAKIDAAHGRLRERSSAVADERHLFGVVRLTGGRLG